MKAGWCCGLFSIVVVLLLTEVGAIATPLSQCVGNGDDWQLNWDVTGFAQHGSINEGPLNPGNMLAELPYRRGQLEARPDLRWDCAPVTLALSPRFRLERAEVEDFMQRDPAAVDIVHSGFVNKGMLRLDIRSDVSVEFNREALLWGPSLFFSPSNPFTSDNGRNSPHEELPGQDFAIAHLFLGDSDELSFYENFDRGTRDYNMGAFEKTYAVNYAHTATDWTGTLVASTRRSRDLIGGFAQYTLNDYIVLFTDLGVARSDSDSTPDTSTAEGYLQQIGQGKWLSSMTLGASYAFMDGSNVSLEYFYNQLGLTDAQYRKLLALGTGLQDALVQGVPDPVTFVTGMTTLGTVISSRPAGLRRHYLALQYNKNDILSRLDAVARWTYNGSDGSSLIVIDLNTAVSDHCRAFLTVLMTYGEKQDEFKQYYDNRITLGTSVLF